MKKREKPKKSRTEIKKLKERKWNRFQISKDWDFQNSVLNK